MGVLIMTPTRIEVNVLTGESIEVELTPEEIAALPPPEAPAVPQEVTNFQARALLMNMPGSAPGRSLFQDVNDTLQAMGGVEFQAWEYTTVFPRQSALIAAIAAQLNLTEAQLDQMFIAAAAISV
jgi:hypothetical protein